VPPLHEYKQITTPAFTKSCEPGVADAAFGARSTLPNFDNTSNIGSLPSVEACPPARRKPLLHRASGIFRSFR
jgi:hypothetical protein